MTAAPAAERWRNELAAWAIPQDLLDAVPDSPYGWPADLWRRRSVPPSAAEEPVTTGIVRRLLGRRGSLLDVGAGTGRASLPLAGEGHALVAVEQDPGMADGLRAEAAVRGVALDLIVGPWPDVIRAVPQVDVTLSANVVYDVPEIAPFLGALADRARRAVVVELTETHPWSHLAPYYLALHGLRRPAGPSVEDFVAVVREVVGSEPQVERWRRSASLWFEDWDEILAFYGRRLVLPRSRWPELRRLLDSEVRREGNRLYVGERVHVMATVWWEVAGGR